MSRRKASTIRAVIGSQPDELDQVLERILEEHGTIPAEQVEAVSQNLGVPLVEVQRVASFYNAFYTPRLRSRYEDQRG